MMTAEEALALANQYTNEHGGGGGTSDYSQLTNKPQVNGVTLVGNKTTGDLIPIGNGLGFNTDGELEATGGSDVLVIEAVIYNETPEIYSIRFGKSLTEIVSDIEGVNGNAIVKIWTTSSKLKCYLSETFNDDGSGNWVTNVRRYSNDIVCRDVLMIGNSSDNKKSVWKYPLQKNLTFDSTPTQNSSNPVTSGGIYNALQNAGTSDYSQLTNMPQINGVTLSGNKTSSNLGLQDKLTFDAQPTKNSNKPVTSDGIYRQIESRLKNHTPWLTAQNASTIGYERINLFNLTLDRIKQLNTDGTWADNVYTHEGVTFTVNHTDGVVESIVTNGTAVSNDAELIVDDAPINADATYYANGCAAGGGATKYGVNCVITDQTHQVNDSWALYDDTDEWEVTARVIGYFKYTIFVYAGESANNKEFYPMLSVYENSEFVPSVPTINTRINGIDTRVQILENGGDRSLNYSTTEQVVGTWIDGKPLYQKTFHIEPTFTEQSRAYTVQTGLSNVEKVVGYDEVGMINQALRSLPMFNNSGELLLKSQYRPQDDEIEVYCAASTVTTDVYPYVDITIRYTKTTD